MNRPLYLLLVMVSASSGCISFNPGCPHDDSQIVGFTQSPLDLRPELLRAHEAPAGNLVADAFYDYASQFGADLALVNAGAIRGRTECLPDATILPGRVTRAQLADMLPFGNDVVLVRVSQRQLLLALEHSVSHLGDPGPAGLSGQLLHLSHLRIRVDCQLPAAVGQQVGQRITQVQIVHPDGTEETLDLGALSDEVTYIVATNSFLADGGDGYEWLRARIQAGTDAPSLAVVDDYIEKHSPIAPQREGRMVVSQCQLGAE